MEENGKKPVKKGRNIGIVSIIIGVISIPLFCVYYIGPVLAILGTILALISIPSTSEGRKEVSWASNIGLAINLLSLLGGLAIMGIIWYGEKQKLTEAETSMMVNLYNIFKLYR